MLDIIRYFFAVVFLLLTIYFGIRGFVTPIGKPVEKKYYKDRAICYTAATFCGLISFELYYPALAALICIPILLLGIWMEYLTAQSFFPRE
jgi:hypothetical protein